ncbi:hypothetical protein SY89_03517 [Halolamina pelagica]|uniref:Uncharacterized protein n=1 Tax=Halolamina pelagica TaxID=699431 RepID=A0A0N8HZE5_9EURY|nr:hypothetical protein SY89_03137 [Halolamina pelagica]KPN29283.1 hypothetical protein SY89_03517 [Halolamina pelagica]
MIVISGYVDHRRVGAEPLDELPGEFDIGRICTMSQVTDDQYGVDAIGDLHRVDVVATPRRFEVEIGVDEKSHRLQI